MLELGIECYRVRVDVYREREKERGYLGICLTFRIRHGLNKTVRMSNTEREAEIVVAAVDLDLLTCNRPKTDRQTETKPRIRRRGKTREDKTRQEKTRQDKRRQDKTREEKTRQDKTT